MSCGSDGPRPSNCFELNSTCALLKCKPRDLNVKNGAQRPGLLGHEGTQAFLFDQKSNSD